MTEEFQVHFWCPFCRVMTPEGIPAYFVPVTAYCEQYSRYEAQTYPEAWPVDYDGCPHAVAFNCEGSLTWEERELFYKGAVVAVKNWARDEYERLTHRRAEALT